MTYPFVFLIMSYYIVPDERYLMSDLHKKYTHMMLASYQFFGQNALAFNYTIVP